jgi:hypothetical protein
MTSLMPNRLLAIIRERNPAVIFANDSTKVKTIPENFKIF